MKIFRTYLSFFPMCLGLYHVFVANHDISNGNGLFMTAIGYMLSIYYGYYFFKWMYSFIQSFNKTSH